MGSGLASMMGGSGETLLVYYSLDNGEWTKVGEYTQSDYVVFKAPLSGLYRLKFTGKNVNLDNFLGFKTPIEEIALYDGADNSAVLA